MEVTNLKWPTGTEEVQFLEYLDLDVLAAMLTMVWAPCLGIYLCLAMIAIVLFLMQMLSIGADVEAGLDLNWLSALVQKEIAAANGTVSEGNSARPLETVEVGISGREVKHTGTVRKGFAPQERDRVLPWRDTS